MSALHGLLVLALGMGTVTPAQPPAPGLSGRYRVAGECAELRDDGSLAECTSWNPLELHRDGAGIYRYQLQTWTFATTAGGGDSSGTLQLVPSEHGWQLHSQDGFDAQCQQVLVVDAGVITLREGARQ